MLNTVQENAAEEIAVNPDQAAHAIKNVDNLTGNTSVKDAIMNPNLVTGSLNHSFLTDKNWQDYAADPLRTFKEENRHLFGIENMAKDPVWYSTVDRYGKELAQRSMAIHGYVKPADSLGSRIIEAYDNARYGLRVSAARKDLSDARLDGDPVKIAEAEARYEAEQKNLELNGTPFEDYGNTIMQLAASFARNPEVMLAMGAGAAVTAGVGAALAPVAAGAMTVGAGAAGVTAAASSNVIAGVLGTAVANLGSAAIVGADTYRLESGSALQELDAEHPELTEERKHEIARNVGVINAAIESVPTALAGGVIGRLGGSVQKAVTRAVMKSNLSEATVRNPAFIKALKEGVKDATFGKIALDLVVDANIEGGTEMLQDIVQKAAMEVADNPDTTMLQNMAGTIANLVTDPLSKENAELWSTYINVALASPLFGAPMTGVRVASVARHRGSGTLQDKFQGVQRNKNIAQAMFDYRQNSESAKANPAAASEHLRQMIKSEGINGEVYLDKQAVAELRKDPEIAKKLDELGVPQAVEDSAENGGNIIVDLVKYDEVVNTDKTLYQKIKDIVSFQPKSLSVSEMTRFLEGIDTKGIDEIVKARGEENSVYNQAYKMFKDAGYGDYEAKFNASVMQMSLNRIGGFRQSRQETAQQVMQRLSLNIAGRKGAQDISFGPQVAGQRELLQEVSDLYEKNAELDLTNPEYTGETMNLADENARLDDIYPAYEGKTIRIIDTAELKQAQFEKIQETNPMLDSYHVGIRSVNDIKTFDETINDEESFVWGDYSREDAKRDLAKNEITIYSSKPIENGVFVSTSRVQAQEYAGGKGAKVYERTVPLDYVAWISGDEGQFALTSVVGKKRSVFNSNGERIAKSEAALRNFYAWFGDSKVVDEQGRPLVVYHGSAAEFDTFSTEADQTKQRQIGADKGFFFTDSEKVARRFVPARPQAKADLTSQKISAFGSVEAYEDFGKRIRTDAKALREELGDDRFASMRESYFNIGSAESATDFLYDPQAYGLYKVYLKAESVSEYNGEQIGVGEERAFALESAKQSGKDGVIIYKADTGAGTANEYIVFEPNQIKSVDNRGTFGAESDNIFYQFVGSRNVETANAIADTLGKRAELDRARAMADEAIAKGEAPDYEAIWAETGWYQNEDTSWSYEIADNEATLDKGKFFTEKGVARTGVHTTLGAVLKHDKLFDLFPELKDIPFHIGKSNTSGKQNRGSLALYVPGNKPEIIVSATEVAKAKQSFGSVEEALAQTKSSILHELQHYLQDKMGMMYFPEYRGDKGITSATTMEQSKEIIKLTGIADKVTKEVARKYNVNIGRGGLRGLFARRNELLAAAQTEEEKQLVNDFVDKYVETGDYNITYSEDYYRKSFEMQARNTQARVNFTEEQRRTVSPSATKDIAGTVEVGRSVSKQELEKNTRRVGLIKFSGQPTTTEQAPAVAGVEQTVAQPATADQQVAGFYTSDAQTGAMGITLTKDANATTFAHEAFHMFVDNLIRAVNDKDVTAYWEDKAIKMIKAVDGQVSEDGTISLTTAQEEKLANMFMSYVAEGKIQNKTLTPVFAYMSKLFRQLYRDLGLRQYKLNKNIRDVFDSVFRSQDEIEYHQRLVGIFEMEKPASADQTLYDFYIAEMLNSRAKGGADLRKKLFAIENFKKSDAYKNAFEKHRLAALRVLGDTIAYRIVNDLAKKYNNNPDLILQDLIQEDPEIRMTIDDVKKIIQTTPPMEQAAAEQAETEMETLLKKRFKIADEELGFNEERNMSKIRALVAESLMRSGKTMADFEAEMQRVSDAVKSYIGKTSLKRLLDKNYWNDQEAKIVDWYALALSKGDDAAMAECRYNQAVVNLIRMRADVIANKVTRFKKFAESIRFAQKKVEHTFDGTKTREDKYTAEAYDLLQSIVEKFGFKINYERREDIPVGKKLNNWIDKQEQSTFTSAGVLRDWIGFITDGYSGTLDAMKGGMFENLYNVVDAVEGVASSERAIILDNQKRSVTESLKETADSFTARNLKPFDESTTWWAKTFGTLGKYTNPEALLAAIFPRSVMNKIWLPLINSCVKGEAKGRELVAAYQAAKGRLGGINSNSKTYATGDTMRFNDVCDLFLSMGNEHAYSNFVIKFFGADDSNTRGRAESIVSEAIKDNPKLVDFVNKVWSLYKEVADIATNTYKDRENKPFIAKSHREFTINGIKFEGGYVPEHKSNDGFKRPENNNFYQQGLIREHGFEKLVIADADGNVKSIVDTTEFELFESAKESLLGVDFNNAVRFMQDSRTRGIIGTGAYKYINDWMLAYRRPHYDESGMLRGLTTLTTMSALGFRLSTALMQVSGIVQAMSAVGVSQTLRAMRKNLTSYNDMRHPLKAAAGRSTYMETRMGDPNSVHLGMSVTDLMNSEDGKTLVGKFGKMAVKRAMTAAMFPIQLIDGYVANVTWDAAYQAALDSGMTHDEAVLQADSAVRQVQSDAMQISRAPAMQPLWARAVTAFGTWIMAMQSFVRAKWGTNQKGDAVKFAIMYLIVSTMLEAVLKQGEESLREAIGLGDDEDPGKDFVDKALEKWYNQVVETAGATALPFAGLGSLGARLSAAGIEKGLTGENEIFSTYTGGIPFMQTASKIVRTGQYGLESLTSGLEEEPTEKMLITGTSIFNNEVSKIVKSLLED